jgi:hypothetical protein
MSERRPTMQKVIDAAVEAGLADIRTVVPAKVVKWDATKGRADCQVLVKVPYHDEEDDRQVKSFPVVPGVPVQFFGAGGYRFTCPISDGTVTIDEVRAPATMGSLFFSHVSLDKWLSGTGREVDPELDHHHAPADAIFVPGLMPFGSPWSSIPTDHATIGCDSGVQIHFHSTTIAIGDESGNDFVALASKVKAWLDAFNAAVTGWTPVANDGGAALKLALTTLIGGTPTTDVAATQAKAK